MSTDTWSLCPQCQHDRESHDPQLGCLIPWCWCEYEASPWRKRFAQWLGKAAASATAAGILMAVGMIAWAMTLSACLPLAIGQGR